MVSRLTFFDEFEYTFDLNDANDWDHYEINQNTKLS